MTRILVLGGSGLLGVNFCIKNRYKYKIFSWNHTRKIKLNGISYNNQKLNKINFQNFIIKKKIDIVCNFAGLTSIEKCQKNKKMAQKLNFKLIKELYEVINKNKLLLVHISTDHIFKSERLRHQEASELKAWNYYALTKIEAEKFIKKKIARYIIIRTNFFGWGTQYRKSITDKIIEKLRKKEEIKIWKNVFFTPVYVGYLSDLIIKLIQKKFEGVINIGSDNKISKFNFAIKIAKQFNFKKYKIKPTMYNDKYFIKRPKNMCLSNDKIKKVLPGENLNFIIDKQIQLMKFDFVLKKKSSNLR